MKIKDFKNLVSFSGNYNELTNKPTIPNIHRYRNLRSIKWI